MSQTDANGTVRSRIARKAKLSTARVVELLGFGMAVVGLIILDNATRWIASGMVVSDAQAVLWGVGAGVVFIGGTITAQGWNHQNADSDGSADGAGGEP